MPRCPNCAFTTTAIADFVYGSVPYEGEEGHDVNPYEDADAERYLVCPACEAVLG